MSIFTRFRVWLGFICPIHHARTYYDNEYDKLRCSVTGRPVSAEYRQLAIKETK